MVKSVVFIVAGAALLIAAVVTGLDVRRFVARSIPVPGRVVRLNAGGSHPEIAFRTRAGESVSFPQGGFIWGYRVGDAVTVRYREDAPRRSARIDSVGALWFGPILLTLLGLGVVLAGGSGLSLHHLRH